MIKKRWEDLEDVRYAIHLAGEMEPNPEILLQRMIKENDTSLMDLLEEKDKEAKVLRKKQKERDKEAEECINYINTLELSEIDSMDLKKVKVLLKKIITRLR